MLKHEDLQFLLQVFQWKIGDTFYIEKWLANEHTYLGFTRPLGHRPREKMRTDLQSGESV